jgi:hypothetical protein
MDRTDEYRRIVQDILRPYVSRRYANADIQNEAVFDQENDRYLVMSVGWQGRIRRIHGCLLHLDLIDGKVWIQRDGTEDGVAYELEAAGIPKSDIVPAFQIAEDRALAGYAVA